MLQRIHVEKEQRARDETRKAYVPADRRANALANQLDESRTLLEHIDRSVGPRSRKSLRGMSRSRAWVETRVNLNRNCRHCIEVKL